MTLQLIVRRAEMFVIQKDLTVIFNIQLSNQYYFNEFVRGTAFITAAVVM